MFGTILTGDVKSMWYSYQSTKEGLCFRPSPRLPYQVYINGSCRGWNRPVPNCRCSALVVMLFPHTATVSRMERPTVRLHYLSSRFIGSCFVQPPHHQAPRQPWPDQDYPPSCAIHVFTPRQLRIWAVSRPDARGNDTCIPVRGTHQASEPARDMTKKICCSVHLRVLEKLVPTTK